MKQEIPVDGVIVEKKDASELPGGVEVGPVNGGTTGGRGGEDEGGKRGIDRSEKAEVWRRLSVAVARMDRRRRRPPSPLLAHHRPERQAGSEIVALSLKA